MTMDLEEQLQLPEHSQLQELPNTTGDHSRHILSLPSPSSLSPSPFYRPSHHREPPPDVHLSDPDVFDTDDHAPPLPSPQYNTFASSSNVNLDVLASQQSPPYRSQATSMDHTPTPDEKHREPDVEGYTDLKAPQKPFVHYSDDVQQTPAYTRVPSHFDSSPPPFLSEAMRTSSFASTVDDDGSSEGYDWSGDDDLVDQEAKFEQQMGKTLQKNDGWGFKRCVKGVRLTCGMSANI